MRDGASLHESTEPREVLGIDGRISVVGPDDVLVVRLAQRLTVEDARRVADRVAEVLGPNRCLLFDQSAELTVVRDSRNSAGAREVDPA